ncbi:prepilin peptidase [Amycolatopsis antarctica]|uniref:Prepilin peptidase n=1 Tax=Amycolatopsis antarctica TaxID=1854586 RepID=A0A263D6U8_9PSEU|nr:prepilin peptidase [Amycolatopsis antarctica]
MSIIVLLVAGATAGLLGARLLRTGVHPAVVPAWPCACVTAFLWAVTGLRWQAGALPGWWLPTALGVAFMAVPLVAADLRHRRLPDVLTLGAWPLFTMGLAIAAWCGPGSPLAVRALTGALLFGGVHAAVRAVSPGSLGAGDVKLAFALGAVLGALGWTALVLAAVLAAIVTVLFAAAGALRRSDSWRSGVPHGPGMLAAAWLLTVFQAVRPAG